MGRNHIAFASAGTIDQCFVGELNSRISLVRTSLSWCSTRGGPERAFPVPSRQAGTRATRSRRFVSSLRAGRRQADGGFEIWTSCPVSASEPNPFPERPDAVMSMIGRGRHSVLRIFKDRLGRTGHRTTCGALPTAGPYLRLRRFQVFSLGRNLPPYWGCIPPTNPNSNSARGATGSGHDGALTTPAPPPGDLGPALAEDASPDYNSDSVAARFSSWAVPGSLAVTKGILNKERGFLRPPLVRASIEGTPILANHTMSTGDQYPPPTKIWFDNDPSAGSPTETLLRLLLPLNDKVQWNSRDVAGSEPHVAAS
ncbi:hypothetical protein Tco_0319964 [Tanacetum coccineum]